MNFRDLVTRLDLIEDAGLTLATVKAAEDAAKEKASVEKAKGGWSGFTSWDPKTAGNIAVAQLAQANRLEGLFNSEGDFVVAYGSNEWSSKEGQSPRVVPPTPEDWKPLASLGLIPDNAKGPAGLTSWLTGGKSKQEFDAVKQQSAGVRQAAVTSPVVAPTDLKSTSLSPISSEVPASKSLDPGEELVPKSGSSAPSEKAKEVDDLLKQYTSMDDQDADKNRLARNTTNLDAYLAAGGAKGGKAAIDSGNAAELAAHGENPDNAKYAQFDKDIADLQAKDAKLSQTVTEGMHKSLVESFGYTVNEGFWDTAGKVISHPGTAIGLGATIGAVGDERTDSKEGMFGWKWDQDIMPPIPYTLRDLIIDGAITAGGMAVGALGGPPGEAAVLAANAGRIKKLISVAKAVGGKYSKTMLKTAIPAQLQFNIAQDMAHAVKNAYKSKDNCTMQMPGQPPVEKPCPTN